MLIQLHSLLHTGERQSVDIFLAQADGQTCVVKRYPKDKISESLLKRELANITNVAHDKVVNLLFQHWQSDEVYVGFEYCMTGDLFTHMSLHSPLSEWTAKTFMLDILSGLERIHSKGIMHRELASENILIANGVAKITGFTESVAILPNRIYSMKGIPDYMAPEQILGFSYDHKVDMWAAGCLLFEMLTGNTPYNADETSQLVRRILQNDKHTTTTISARPLSLIESLLTEADERLDSTAALQHEWFLHSSSVEVNI